MEVVELVYLYSNNLWDEVSSMDDTGIILVYNSPTSFSNSLLLNAEI